MKESEIAQYDETQQLIEKLANAFPKMDHQRRVSFFSSVLSQFGPYLQENWQFWLDIYEFAEISGIHLLPVHYYSPIPEIQAYPNGDSLPLLFQKDFGVDIPPKAQDDLFVHVCNFAGELVEVPFDEEGLDNSEMRWKNPMFGVMDSCVYYAMIRHYTPNLVLEIGSGFSTLVALKAAAKNSKTVVECVEPFPTDFFSRHLLELEHIKLTVAPVQDVPLDRFSSLKPNDILFIDSSHVCKSGSDLEYLMFRVLPKLPSGVIVHIHDIYLPYNYPRSMLEEHRRFWNENYLIGAFLANNSAWETLVSSATLNNTDNIRKLCNVISQGDYTIAANLTPICAGGSLWIRKL
jgi:Methyltransferase domain